MQLDLFDVLYEDFKFDKPIRTITSFSGIGFQEMGMDLAEIPFKVLNTVEIDKFAMLSYAAIHTNYLDIRDTYEFPDKEVMVEYLQERNIGVNINTWKQTITHSTNIETVKDFYLASVLNNNLGDITKVKGMDIQDDIDLLTYSFPCTDLSKAGQRAGLQGGTRSGLVYEVLRLLHELHEADNLPKVLIMENVVDLIQVNFIDEWNKIALEIEEMGYTNFTQILNAKDYGIAQNRQRVFMVSILGEYNYNFPRPIDLEYRLKDYLEDEVDESLYLSDRKIAQYRGWNSQGRPLKNVRGQDSVIPTITARSQGDDHGQTILLHGGENTINVDRDYIPIPEATDKGWKEVYEGDGVYHNRPHQKRGVVQDGMIQTLKANNRDVGVVVKAVAQRGRYNDNGVIEQQFETGEDISNALTTVQKDMYVGTYQYSKSDNFMKGKSRFQPDKELSDTLQTSGKEGVVVSAKRQLTNAMLESGNFEAYDMVRHSYTANRMEDLERKEGENNIGSTLTTRPDTLGVVEPKENYLRIRKLSPRETARLMGMQDYQFDKQIQVTSDAQAYKQHGNGIVAQVIGMIIGMMWYENENELRDIVNKNSHTWIKENLNEI